MADQTPASPVQPRLVPLAPVRDRGYHSTPLPAPPTSFVGRTTDIAAVSELLLQDRVRLVTLTGPGGIGKTRLAIAVAEDLADYCPDGVAFVALAAITDPDLVATTIAQALGIHLTGTASAKDQSIRVLRNARLLLVIDNFEQVLSASPLVADLLAACEGLRILVTSRERLHLSAERIFPVPPLSTGDEAVRLFVDRAGVAHPGFALSDEDTAAVEELCARLGGIALAIELAAAQSAVLPPRALLKRLVPSLPWLNGGPRDAPARHRTMRDAIAWSYDLLSVDEQALFRQLAVFVGGFTIDAAETVRVYEAGEERSRAPGTYRKTSNPSVIDGIAALVAKSLVQRDQDVDGEPRFQMLETIHEFATERLAESGESRGAQRAHAAWFQDLAERAQPELTKPNAGVWLDRLDREHNDLRAALSWLEINDSTGFLRLAAALGRFWDYRGHLTEGRRWLAIALDSVGVDWTPNPAFAEAATLAGLLALRQGDYDDVLARVDAACAAWRMLENSGGEARALYLLGAAAEYQGNDEEAEAIYEHVLTAYRGAGDVAGIAVALDNLSDVAFRKNDYARATSLAMDAIASARESGFPARLAGSLTSLGQATAALGDRPRALDAFRESLRISREFGYAIGVADALAGLAAVATAAGESRQAARLLGAAAEIAETRGVPQLTHEALLRRAVASTRAALDEPTFEAARAEGRALTIEQAIAEALEPPLAATTATRASVSPRSASSPTASVTRRQAQILPLLAAGLTDREIAAVLYLSHRTIEHHVARLAARLGVKSRAALVGAAYAAGLLDSRQSLPRD